MSIDREKAELRAKTCEFLARRGVDFTFVRFNDNTHLQIGSINFWPGTGRWIGRGVEGYTLQSLLEHLDT